ncbi:type II secretion system protein N [Pseudomonas guariconensis]|uniref:type II secretion system protein N n=1 Tax=Pseudomonas guariconensis TaxID=1288410 RepID=UPI0018AAC55F|nr:type II secretion system protein N [Pseudomonas guariconensis]MBF8721137.1 protein XcpP [Pseudomonas guariconensis]MBF8794850.1 protein XcpP [Pseudomonas monteilii]
MTWREMAGPGVASATIATLPVAPASAAEKPLPVATLALAFGFQAPGQPQSSRSDITLKATFVSSQGDARALVKSANGDAIHRVGDRLPGGGVLRRIDVRSIVLWLNGREEVVSLSASASPVFQPSGSTTGAASVSSSSPRLLREVQ